VRYARAIIALAANSELLIQYFRDEAKWVIVGAECTT
jgi:hypothetical protein